MVVQTAVGLILIFISYPKIAAKKRRERYELY